MHLSPALEVYRCYYSTFMQKEPPYLEYLPDCSKMVLGTWKQLNSTIVSNLNEIKTDGS